MSKKTKETSVDLMMTFGRFLKFLRCPDIYLYKLKMAQKYEEAGNISGVDELYQSDLAFFDELFPDEILPDSFRELQASARRYKLKMYSLREISDVMGISKNTLHDYEQGKRYPSIEFIYDYCGALKIPLDEVINEWLRCHPQQNIREHASVTLEEHYAHHLSPNFDDEKRKLARDFFAKAILYSLERNKVVLLDGEKLSQVAVTFGGIIDKSLAKGLSLDPNNLTHSIVFSTDEHLERFDL